MTREEAKKIFLSRGWVEVEGGIIYDANKWREACVVISKWLEQQPREDAISRQEIQAEQQEACEYYALYRHDRDENKLHTRLGFCEYCNEDADGYVKPIEKNYHAFIRFGMNGWELSLKANGWHGSAKIRYCPMCGRNLLVK